MLFHRMAAKLPSPILILWATAITVARAVTFSLSSDVTGFIPQCALLCFESFLEANFSPDLCGKSPSLQCLCSRTGSSGFTIGEGAVQCIVAENHVGACLGMDASSQVVASAYQMCSGQLSAAPETHATIVATLVLPTNTGPVIVPSPTSASRSTSVTSSQTTDKPTSISWLTMSAAPAPSTSSASSAGNAAPTPTASVSDASPTSSQPNSSSSSKGQLSTAVIAGIAAGGTAAVLLAVVLILVLRCTHRKKAMLLESENSGFSRMRDSWGSPKQPKGGPSPHIPQISAPRYQEPELMEYTRALANNSSSSSNNNKLSARPETIGLAISAGEANATGGGGDASMPPGSPPTYMSPKRPPQTPPKPSLTLTIPPKATVRDSPPQPPRMPFNGGRDSVVTEFAEDGEVEPASAGGVQIWRPPSSDPQSATAYYVADRWGNWVLNNTTRQSRAAEAAQPDRTMGGDKSLAPSAMPALPKPRPASALPARPPQVRLVPPEDLRLPTFNRSSSVYSNYSFPQTVAPGPQNPVPNLPAPPPDPEAYYSSFGGRRRSSSSSSAKGGDPRRKSRGAPQRTDTLASHDSVTTIASSTSGALDGADAAYEYEVQGPGGNNLSPVAESPQSGHSPVTYPSIPRPRSRMFGRARGAAVSGDAASSMRLFPPAVKYEYHPPGQPSPTLGLANSITAVPVPPQSSAPRRPGLNPNPNRNPGQVLTGSPNVPQQEDLGSQQQQQQQQPPQQPPSLSTGKGTPRSDTQDWQKPQQPREPTPTLNAFPVPPMGSSALPVVDDDPFFALQSQYPQQSQQQHSATPTSTHSNASSLLAKRLGSEKAAALALTDQQHGKGKWKRQSRAGRIGTPRRDGAGEREFSFVEQEGHVDGRVQLPATPGWLPKLTPTRRGDELFLSVQ